MAWPKPEFTKNQINKAGTIFLSGTGDLEKIVWAFTVLDNWRSCHGYPINTFQATLRQKLKNIDQNAIVAQRLKRWFSIVEKLKRFKSMQLARMQDIGGLRAVVATLDKVRVLEANYRNTRFNHELVGYRDYISNPKKSGYRSVHLVYRYNNPIEAQYDGLHIELQIRTRLQHAWATAVETAGTFLDHALKSSEGPEMWLNFFSITGSAFAHIEKTPPVPGYEDFTKEQTFKAVIERAHLLGVRQKLVAYSVAAGRVYDDRKSGSYHLVILNPNEKTVNIQSYSQSNLDEASKEYSRAEQRIADGEPIQAVLVSAGSIKNLRRAYPNYFLDTREFIQGLSRIEKLLKKSAGNIVTT
jgi:putative GTP pyrophosphokinase